jgi:hypothetical protein
MRAGAAIREYHLDDAVVLFQARSSKLFVLNGTASRFWKAWTIGDDYDAVIDQISRETGVPTRLIDGDCRALIEQWQAAGILSGDDTDEPALSPEIELPRAPASSPRIAPARHFALQPTAQPATRDARAYRLLDTEFRFVAVDEVAADIDQLLRNLRSDSAAAAARSTVLEARLDERGWALLADGETCGRCAVQTELPSLVLGTMLATACKATPSLALLHAAAVSRGPRCVLLPGASGSGKSTLTAALTTRGYEFCADDLSVLKGDPVGLEPIPLPLGLKSGSWPLLERFLPELADTPIRPRVDGKRIKYLLPANRPAPGGAAPLTVAAIVFPTLGAAGETALEPIARGEALLRITAAGYDVNHTINTAWVDSMTSWLQGVSCYELRYRELDDALAAFDSVLA